MVTSLLVKRRYQCVPRNYHSDNAIDGAYHVVSPIGTTLCLTDTRQKGDLLAAALNYYDPEGECTL